MNNLGDDANRVDNASTAELWLANLVMHLYTLTVLASSFATRDAQVCSAPHAGNNTNCLIAVPYLVVEKIIVTTPTDVCFTPYWVQPMNTLTRH